MVFGYPGTTNEYLTSFAIEQIQNIENPHKIAIRTAKLNIINAAMESDELLRIKYASKAAGIANAWKKWQGEIKGLKRFNTVAKKQREEAAFQKWASSRQVYNNLLDSYQKLYEKRKDLVLAAAYLNEAGKRGAEIVGWSASVRNRMKDKNFAENPALYKQKLKKEAEEYYKDYDLNTDKKILVEMLKLYHRNLPEKWIPEEVLKSAGNKGPEAYVENLFEKSLLVDTAALFDFIDKSNAESYKKLEKDPFWKLYTSMDELYIRKIKPELDKIQSEIVRLNQVWLAGLMEIDSDKVFYADANSTLRVAYGKVQGYSPYDGAYYKHYTTLKGIMEKDNPEIYDYNVPQRLREIYQKRDFGTYAQDGEVPVCFIATNHTTGGNSGSPVLNSEGHLIGLNFDRAWDGVMSDMQYDSEICRNISVDIRYVLFIIDKLAGAGHLIDEMIIVE